MNKKKNNINQKNKLRTKNQKTANRKTRSQNSGSQSNSKPSAKFKGKGEIFCGIIDGSPKGYGFLMCAGREDDIFIPAYNMNGAMHGDKVNVRLVSQKKSGGEGEVVDIIERGMLRIVGTYHVSQNEFAFVEPDSVKIPKSIAIIKSGRMNATEGDKVVIELVEPIDSEKLNGQVVEVLGAPDEKFVDMLSIIRAHNLYETFPPSVEKEANAVSDTVTEQEKKDRVDYTNDLIITIDGDDSRDFDDAVSVIKTDDGLFRLSVHIADVAHYVRLASKLDKEALKRGTSVYFPDMVLPMLPKKLSNGICSLNEGVDRLTLSVIMDISTDGQVVHHKIKEGVIKSSNRMTYSKVTAILEGDKDLCTQYTHLVPMLEDMQDLSKILFNKRKRRGTVEFEVTESQIILDEKTGKVIDIAKKPRQISHRIIEEFMLAANETVAEFMFGIEAPFVYRAHENPPSEKLEVLKEFLKALNIKFEFSGDSPAPIEFQKMLSALPEALSRTVNKVALRSMAKATYEPQNLGHYGLAAEFYCHFTSPIRRYPDLIIHRIIKDYLKNGKACFSKYEEFVVVASKLSSERERAAEKAEREVCDLKKAEFMRDKIGNEYSGVISGVTEFGIFVELENSVEGLINTERLPGFYYAFNQSLLTLSNQITTFRIGDKIQIIVEAVNGGRVLFGLKDSSTQE